MKYKFVLFVIVLILAVAVGVNSYLKSGKTSVLPKGSTQITSFEECAKAGNPILESYPRQCKANGKTFVEEVKSQGVEKDDLLIVDNITNGEMVASPLKLTGKARGSWYFEGTFPVFIYDNNGKLISQENAEAQDEWTTNEFVPFEVTLPFDTPETLPGEIILQKSNPSGLAENDDELVILVRFSENSQKGI